MSDVERIADEYISIYKLADHEQLKEIRARFIDGFKVGQQYEKSNQYVPGVMKCAKCDCSVISQTLNIMSGSLTPNIEHTRCPNNCGPMWRVTWEEYSKITDQDLERSFSSGQRSPAVKALLEWIGPCVCDPSQGSAAICGACEAVRNYENEIKEPT